MTGQLRARVLNPIYLQDQVGQYEKQARSERWYGIEKAMLEHGPGITRYSDFFQQKQEFILYEFCKV